MSEVPGQGPGQSNSFDELARNLASGSLSRRRALKIFGAAVVGALIPSRALAQTCPGNQVLICHRLQATPQTSRKSASARMRLIGTWLTTHATVRARARSVSHVRHHRRRDHRGRLLLRNRVAREGNGAGRAARSVAAT
jgi:hypothetical protein